MRRVKKAGIGLLLCLCICLCAGAVIFAVRRRDSGELEYSETEFRELLDENALLYEQNLRDAYSIPDDVSVKDCLGDSYDEELAKENEKYIARRRAVQILAEQLCTAIRNLISRSSVPITGMSLRALSWIG